MKQFIPSWRLYRKQSRTKHKQNKFVFLSFIILLVSFTSISPIGAQTPFCSVNTVFANDHKENPDKKDANKSFVICTSPTGYFNLSFDPSFTQDECDIMCQVFADLSNMIQNSENQPVDIEIVSEAPRQVQGQKPSSLIRQNQVFCVE